jgi:hypothetical protein
MKGGLRRSSQQEVEGVVEGESKSGEESSAKGRHCQMCGKFTIDLSESIHYLWQYGG